MIKEVDIHIEVQRMVPKLQIYKKSSSKILRGGRSVANVVARYFHPQAEQGPVLFHAYAFQVRIYS
jgi:hypothetical protein